VSQTLLAVPFGLAIGLLLGTVGGGGSILAVPVLVYVLGEPVQRATTASLLIVGVTALAGAVAAGRHGRVAWRVAVLFAPTAGAAAVLGTALNRALPPRALLVSFALLLLLAAAAMLRRRSAQREAAPAPRWSRAAAAGGATGALTGLFGVGGGFVVVPALTLAVGLPMQLAVGTSLAVIALTSAVAFAAHLSTGGLDLMLALTFTGAGVLGAVAGTRLGARARDERLRRLFALLLVVAALGVLGESAAALL